MGSLFSTQLSRNPKERRSQIEARQFVEEHGVDGIDGFFQNQMNAWKSTQLNFLVTGQSGSGKSSFINAIRGLEATDKGAAEVGTVETTLKKTPYTHPSNSKLVFWDVPGFGTPGLPSMKGYLKEVDIEMYDAFLFIARSRFHIGDLRLAKEVKSMNKPFFFIRAHMDTEINNARRSQGKNFDEVNTLQEIKRDCYKNLEELLTCEDDIYVIDNFDREMFEFDRLMAGIEYVLPPRGKECFVLSLSNLTRGCLKRKAALLRANINSYLDVFKRESSSILLHIPVWKESMNAFIYLIVQVYRDHLGLPEENSVEFEMMRPKFQEQMRSFYWTVDMEIDFRIWIESFDTGPIQIPKSSFSRWFGEAYVKVFEPLRNMFKGLNFLLDAMEELAFAILNDEMDRELNVRV